MLYTSGWQAWGREPKGWALRGDSAWPGGQHFDGFQQGHKETTLGFWGRPRLLPGPGGRWVLGRPVLWEKRAAACLWSRCPSPWGLQGPLNPLKEASRCDSAWQGRGTGDDNAYAWGHSSGTLLGSWAQPLAGPQTCRPGFTRRQVLSAQSRATRPHEGPLGPGSSRWHGAPPCPGPDIWAAAVLRLGCHDNVGQFPDRRGTGSRGPKPLRRGRTAPQCHFY